MRLSGCVCVCRFILLVNVSSPGRLTRVCLCVYGVVLAGEQDARSFMMSFQYWLGGSPENLESMLLMMANNYVYEGQKQIETENIAEPTLLPDIGIWHPLAPQVFEDSVEYNNWYNKVHAPLVGIDPAKAPTVGVILQKSHINTKDECHYTSLIQELEARGCRVICLYSGLTHAHSRALASLALALALLRVACPSAIRSLPVGVLHFLFSSTARAL